MVATGRLPAALAAAVLVASCSGGPDPDQALRTAVADTFAAPFVYEITIEADRDALAALGEGAGQAADFLRGLRLTGQVGRGSWGLTARLLDTEALALRAVSPEEIYMRWGIRDLAARLGAGVDPERPLRALEALDLPSSVTTAVTAAIRGQWVGVRGRLPAARLARLIAPDPPGPDGPLGILEDAIGGDVPAFLDRFLEAREREVEDGRETFSVALRARDLGRAVARARARMRGARAAATPAPEGTGVPMTVPGTVIARDGRITEVRLSLSGEDRQGSVDLRVSLSRHGAAPPLEPPAEPVMVPAGELLTAVDRLVALTGGLAPPR